MSNNTATIRTLGHLHDLTPDPDLRRCDGSACGRPRAHGHPGSRPDRMSVRHTVSAAVDSFLVDSLSHPTPWGRLGTDPRRTYAECHMPLVNVAARRSIPARRAATSPAHRFGPSRR